MRPRTSISQTMLLTDARLHNTSVLLFVVLFFVRTSISTAAVYRQCWPVSTVCKDG